MELRILPYKLSSCSSRSLATELNALRINPDRHSYRKRNQHRVINWGCSDSSWQHIFGVGDINNPLAVSIACNKLATYAALVANDVPTLQYTQYLEVAQSWIRDGSKVYGRDTASGRSGLGITVYSDLELGDHLFYTRSVDSHREYRVHVGNEHVIDVAQKKLRNGIENPNYEIRSWSNGWIFARNNIVIPEGLIEVSTKAIKALGLDFGAVDICIDRAGKFHVFEVNTAPGIEGTTLSKYVEFFRSYL